MEDPPISCEWVVDQALQSHLHNVRAALPPDSPDLYDRQWAVASTPAVAGVKINVMQFNCLADGLCGMNQDKGGFTESPPETLEWGYRRSRLVEESLRHGVLVDIVAMEEIDHYHDWFFPMMQSLGYDGCFAVKPSSPCKHSLDPSLEDGCALFWRKDKITLLAKETLNYDLLDSAGTPTGRKSNQVAILATLRPNGAEPILVAVTHLVAKKNPDGERSRAQQIKQLFDILHAKGLNSIICMDMNAAPCSSSAAEYPAEAYPAALEHSLGVRSVYAAALGSEPSYTTWKRRGDHEAKHTIDYIFVSGPIAVSRVLLPPEEESMGTERLPNWSYPSDHVALFAELIVPASIDGSSL